MRISWNSKIKVRNNYMQISMTDNRMESNELSDLSEIQSFFFGRSIFITGATGLVGKVLVEKLLRCCPGLTMLYLLVRPKRNLTPSDRGNKIFKTKLFKKLREEFPDFQKKITFIEGDLLEDRLGISDKNFEALQENVSVVFHSAARLKFNDTLRASVEHNVVATKVFMDLCHKLPLLVSVVHVSTSYVHRDENGYVEECIPKLKVTPQQILDALEWMDPKCEQAVCNYLLGGGKTITYLVTKAMAENIVEQYRKDLPTVIVRPCFIISTWKDPFPGWNDSLQGLSGLIVAEGKGILRALPSLKGFKVNLIPADVVVNCMIVSAWYVSFKRPVSTYVVNCSLDYEKTPEIDFTLLSFVLKIRDKYPLVNIFRYPDVTIHFNKITYDLHSLIDQWIPAFFMDIFLYIIKGKAVLMPVYKKINFLYDIFLRLGKEPWVCKLENYNVLKKSLRDKDRELFFLETDDLDWPQYIDDCVYGGREFLAREDPSTISYAIKKGKVWWFITTVMKWGLIFLLLYYFLLSSVFNVFHYEIHMYHIQSFFSIVL